LKESFSRKTDLADYLEALYQGDRSRTLYDRYSLSLDEASYRDVNRAIDILIRQHDDFDRIEACVARFIRAAGKGLDRQDPLILPAGHFLELLTEENRALRLRKIKLSFLFKKYSKNGPPGGETAASLLRELQEVSDISSHYRKIEYPLFSALEECGGEFGCTKLMWHIHNGVTAGLKELSGMLENPREYDRAGFNKLFGEVFLKIGALIYREERILFPAAFQALPEERFDAMLGEVPDYGTSFHVEFIPKQTGGSAGEERQMSEVMGNREDRKRELSEIIHSLKDEKDIPKTKKRFSALLKELSPEEVAEAEQALIAEGMPVEEVQKLCEVHVAAFEEALNRGSRKEKSRRVLPGHPVDTYRRENRALRKILREFSRALRGVKGVHGMDHLKDVFIRVSQVDLHYTRKENQLFPYLEEVGFTGPSKVMWGKHDEIRDLLREIRAAMEIGDAAVCRQAGRSAVVNIKRMIFMEEKILFPTALRKLPEKAWAEIRRGEGEIGYAWVSPGNLWDPSVLGAGKASEPPAAAGIVPGGAIDLSVGKLFPDQIDLMLRNLPVDITYVDENDRVRYYSQGRERIFPRSPGIIGRDVQNCHPPKSVHVVQNIVDDFKARRRSEAEFWLQMNGRFLYIRYFPLFEGDAYRGVLEVSQDVTDIRSLEGEKRLLEE